MFQLVINIFFACGATSPLNSHIITSLTQRPDEHIFELPLIHMLKAMEHRLTNTDCNTSSILREVKNYVLCFLF